MIAVFPSREIGAAALVVGLVLAGCSSDSDVPPTVASAPGGGTQINTDTGSGGNFPDVNTTPTQRPSSTIQDLVQAPDGLAGASSGTQYGEALVGGPTSSAAPPPPPPPPPQEALAPIPEAGLQTQASEVTPPAPAAEPYAAEAPAAPSEPIATPDVAEPVAEAAPAPDAPEGQVIQGTMPQAANEMPEAAPEQPAPIATPDPYPQQYQAQPAPAPAPSAGAPQQAQLPGNAYGPYDPAVAPEAYGVSYPRPEGAVPAPIAAPAPQGQPFYGGEPVGLIYFRDGSSDLSSDDRGVLEQIAQIQRAYGGVVNVIGHASMGAAGSNSGQVQQANQRISEARANAVAHQLISFGVPQGAIRTAAAGDSHPLYSEAMPNGAAGNRRVEVYLTAY